MVNWKQDLALSIILLTLAAGFYFAASEYPGTSALFPSYLAPALGFLASILGISAIKRCAPGQHLINWKHARGPVLLIVLMAGFIFILPSLGFILSCFLLATSIFISLGYPNKKIAIVVALVVALAIYLVFHTALEVPLPTGTLWTNE